jgi:biopolymer transport protein ExbD
MSRFRKNKKNRMQEMSTASLPDIVFMLLFFFMVVTTMKEVDLQVEVDKPEATELTRLDEAGLVDYIYIGPSLTPEVHGPEPLIQLDDKIASSPLEIQAFILEKRSSRNEGEIPLITTSLKVDAKTKMGIVVAVKEQLREVNALKINYSTKRGVKD